MLKKTAELTDLDLDFAVSIIEFPAPDYCEDDRHVYIHGDGGFLFAPSHLWDQGGPIIQREKISLNESDDGDVWTAKAWGGEIGRFFECHGKTPLIAAMRCFTSMKLGDEVEIPLEV